MLIKEVAKLWKQDKKQYVKESSYFVYCLLLKNHILPFFGEKEEFVESEIQTFVLDKLESGLSEKSVRDSIVVIKMIQKFGAKKKFWNLTPFDVVFPTSTKKKELEVMTKDNQRKLMQYLKNNFNFENLGLMICLTTGLRIGEVCALKWKDIDMDEHILSVRNTIQRLYVSDGERVYTKVVVAEPKTKNSNRDIPLSKELISVIKPLKKVVNQDYYVVSNSINPTEPKKYRNYYKKLLKKLNLPELKFHGLRHSFATRCIESKSDYKTVSVILGHSNITTTLNLYVHPNNEEKKKCIEKMLKSLR